ncbi:MAG: DNA methylase, partial [Parasporobacterium sp.]|nr:DNA methylase [Parasporobacterium sp.]
DYKSLEEVPEYEGPVVLDFYGRLHPKHSNGIIRVQAATNSVQTVSAALLASFDAKTDHRLLFRRLGVCANDAALDEGIFQMNLFVDYDRLDRESRIQRACIEIRQKYGANSIFKGMNLMEGGTTLTRNLQIGGHRA